MKTLPLALALTATVALAAPPEPKFTPQDVDVKIEIGYGVAVADVDGDGKPDILLADKKQFVWYRNPGKRGVAWDKFILAENLTEKDNVCIAARDIDGDGKCEIAVGAEWNPGDTVNSGAVFYLIPPADRTQKWEAVKFPSVEPTTHRMRWIKLISWNARNRDATAKQEVGVREPDHTEWGLVVVPLHGRGNKNGEGAPVKVLCYHKPDDVRQEWKAELVDESMHATHNFQAGTTQLGPRITLAGREGVIYLMRATAAPFLALMDDPAFAAKSRVGIWQKTLTQRTGPSGAGEVRLLNARGGGSAQAATIEPMHGSEVVFYDVGGERRVLTDKLTDGHALACGDVLGVGSDQIVIGWRGNAKQPRPVGIKLFTPIDPMMGAQWRESLIDDNTMACEDLVLADLDGDGKLDIVAAGRATKNVKIYWNGR